MCLTVFGRFGYVFLDAYLVTIFRCLCSVPFRSACARLVSTVCLDSRALVVTKDDLYYDEDGPVWKGMMAQVESMPSDQHTKNKVIREFKNLSLIHI